MWLSNEYKFGFMWSQECFEQLSNWQLMKYCYVEINRGDPVTGARIAILYVLAVTRLRTGRDKGRDSILDKARI